MTFVAPNLACGKTRGGSIFRSESVTDEQRSHRQNSAQPAGRQVFFGQTSLVDPYRSTSGYARRSRLVWPRNPLPRTSSYLRLSPLSGDVATVVEHHAGPPGQEPGYSLDVFNAVGETVAVVEQCANLRFSR